MDCENGTKRWTNIVHKKTNDPTKFEAYSEGFKLMDDSLINAAFDGQKWAFKRLKLGR